MNVLQWADINMTSWVGRDIDSRVTLHSMSKSAKLKKAHLDIARSVVLEGQSFRKAAVSAGYSQSYAEGGPARMRERVPALNDAFRKVEAQVEWRPTELKQIAVSRITKTCLDDKNSDNLKAAELIGRFKSVDLFVRNGDAQVGIFFGAVEASNDDIAALVPHNPESSSTTQQESEQASPEANPSNLD